MKIHRWPLLSILALVQLAVAETRDASFAGRWIGKDKDVVYEAAPCSSGLCVRIAGLKFIGNGDKNVEGQCGLQVLTLTKWSDLKGRWEGEVLDPKTKKLYPATLEMGKDGKPIMKAHWGPLSFTEPWTKFTGQLAERCEIRGAL